MKITKCPYCSKQLTYFQAFFVRNKGEYFCNKCKKESNVLVRKSLFAPFIIALVISLIILLLFFMLTDKTNFWFVLLVALPFFGFYLLTPFFIDLKPRKKHMDSLYDTGIVESPIVDPDPTVAKSSTVIPAFVDDVVLTDDDKPVINKDIFNAIKEERKIKETASGDTKSFSKFESTATSDNINSTMPIKSIKEITNTFDEE